MKGISTTEGILFGILIAVIAGGGIGVWTLNQKLTATQNELASTTAQYEQRVAELTKEKAQLSEQLSAEQQKNEEFEEQIERITEQVGTIEKIAKTDKELLKKYSKVYFLNENYVPANFAEIPQEYFYKENGEKEHVQQDVWPYLENLLEDAKEDGIDLQIVSAYRSFGEQAGLNDAYTVTYGAGTANQFSAEQGYSEHQLGTTVDVTSPETNTPFIGFENTKAFAWLQNNAYKHGFVLSYPEGNGFYQFEPWHWRFVGEKLAQDLHEQEMHFYDMPQREIDQYLPKLFE